MKLLRFALREQTNPKTQEKMALAMRELIPLLEKFFDDTTDDALKPQPEDTWNATLEYSRSGDFYVTFNDSDPQGVIFIHDRAGTRNGGAVVFNVAPEYIAKAVAHAFTKHDYRKIVVSSHEADPFTQAGFTMTGISPAEGLFNGQWKPIITLEIVSPKWADLIAKDIGEEIHGSVGWNTGHGEAGQSGDDARTARTTAAGKLQLRFIQRAAAVLQSICRR